jgi:hypothetical protein
MAFVPFVYHRDERFADAFGIRGGIFGELKVVLALPVILAEREVVGLANLVENR